MATAPYDTLEAVLNAARVRLNDAYQTPTGAPTGQIGGEVLSDTALFATTTINAAWRRLQEFLIGLGYERLQDEAILSNVTATATSDPGILCYIDWVNYFDGSAFNTSPLLPQEFIEPLRVWERTHGATGNSADFTPMELSVDGISNQPKQARNYSWEWRDDKLYFPGSTAAMDIRVRFSKWLADFVDNATTAYSAQSVPIMRALDAFAWYICSEAANARGDIDGAQFDTKAEAAATKLAQKDAQAASKRAQWVIPDLPPAAGNTNYDSVSTMLNAVRVRLNKAATGAGDIITASQPFTQQCTNNGWRKMQEFLASQNFSKLTNEVVLSALPVAASSDAGVMCTLTWAGYFDGATLHAGIQLPQTLVTPFRVWERVNGSTGAASEFTPMEHAINGLGDQQKTARNYQWEWVNETLTFPGSTSIMDLRIRFFQSLPDFVNGTSPWYLVTIPIARAMDSLAWYVSAEIALARPDLGIDPADLLTKAEDAATKLVNRDVQSLSQRSEWTIPDIPPATGATPYDVVSTMLNAGRARLNSAMKAAGDIVLASQSFTQQCANNAYRKLQEYLANKGSVRLTDEVILTNLEANVNPDPAIQVSLSWAGYFDGTSLNTGIQLPQNMIMPWKLYERQTGIDALFIDMGQVLNGLPSVWVQQPFNRIWEWRSDAIYMPGATQPTDLRIRYHKYLPDFVASGTTPWYLAQILIARSTDSLSFYFCAEVARARPDLGLDAAAFQKSAEDAADLLYNRDVRRTQQTTTTRRSLSGRLENAGGYADGYGQYGY